MSARDEGFSILEALVAFAIMAAVLSALYEVSQSALRIVGKSDRQRQIALLAQSKLDEIAAAREPLPPAEHGTFAGGDVTWRMEAHDLANRGPSPDALHLQSVRLTLERKGGPPFVVETRHLGAHSHA
jgi:type II secretory pathway pseudopilin PulG